LLFEVEHDFLVFLEWLFKFLSGRECVFFLFGLWPGGFKTVEIFMLVFGREFTFVFVDEFVLRQWCFLLMHINQPSNYFDLSYFFSLLLFNFPRLFTCASYHYYVLRIIKSLLLFTEHSL
jgi:hypothetical protein